MLYSIVIPVYKSAAFLKKTVSAVCAEMERIGVNYELILVCDGSPDSSWDVIKTQVDLNQRIVGANLQSNYGQHSAVLFGMTLAKGDYVITMDDDLQNPPSEIIKLITTSSEGYDLVFGQYRVKHHSALRKLGSLLVNFLVGVIFSKPTNIRISNFRCIHSTVFKQMVAYKTNAPYINGLALMFSKKPANVLVEHHERISGPSTYTWAKILKLIWQIVFYYAPFIQTIKRTLCKTTLERPVIAKEIYRK